MGFLAEMIICPVFWIMIMPMELWGPREPAKPDDPDANWQDTVTYAFIIVAGCMDHSLPLICLSIDFSYSCIPVLWRHFAITATVIAIYAVFNMCWTLLVKEIYPLMDWDSTVGAIIPIVIIFWLLLV
jgi:ABC-type Co2+ transport system permease subunit